MLRTFGERVSKFLFLVLVPLYSSLNIIENVYLMYYIYILFYIIIYIYI